MGNKVAGMGDNFYIGTPSSAYNISGDVGSLDTVKITRAVDDVTGIDKSARERIFLIRDGEISFTSFWNAAVGAGHTVLKALPSTDSIATYFRGTAIGNEAASMVGRQLDYNPTRAANGSIRMKTMVQSDGYGIQWYKQLTAGEETHSSATNNTSIDESAGTSFGGAAVWHVFGLSSGTVGGQIQDSSDNLSFAGVTGLTFTPVVTGTTASERVATTTTQAIGRYVRFASTGTFSAAKVAVAFSRNTDATQT